MALTSGRTGWPIMDYPANFDKKLYPALNPSLSTYPSFPVDIKGRLTLLNRW